LKLIFDSFSRSSFLVAISASTLQDGANESAESLQQPISPSCCVGGNDGLDRLSMIDP